MNLSHRLAAIAAEGPPSTSGRQSMAGPTTTSNWVVPGVILCGDAPKGVKLSLLVDLGVQHFVDLRAAAENYLDGLQADEVGDLRYTNFDIQHQLSLGSSAAIAQTAAFLKSIIASAVGHDELTYVHCTDGHSLTTVAVCGILSFIYGISGMKATAVAAQLHGCRSVNDGVHQLLNASQKAFVRSLAEDSLAISESGGSLRSNSAHSLDALKAGSHEAFNESSRGTSPLQRSIGAMPQLAPEALSVAVTHGSDSMNTSQTHHYDGAGTTHARTGRFGNSSGSGGGATHFNIFSSEIETTPTRRGRAAVPGKTEEAVHHRPAATPTKSPNHSSGASTPHRAPPASSVSQPVFTGGHPPQPPPSAASQSGAQFIDPLPPQRVFIERRSVQHGFGLTVHGVTVVRVERGSPAEAAGVAPGSLLRAVDGLEFDVDSSFEALTEDRLRVRLTLDSGYREQFIRSGGASPMKPSSSFQAEQQQQQQQRSAPRRTSDVFASSGSGGGAPAAAATTQSSASHELPPPLNPRTDKKLIEGPTPTSNWVVRGRLCCGDHPDPRKKSFQQLVGERFTTFVSLTETDQTQGYLGPYSTATGLRDLNVLHFALPDGGVVPPSSMTSFTQFISDVAALVRDGREKVYVHCQRGHGRTGIVVTCLLSELYGLNGMRAVNLCDSLHGCRVDTEDRSSPENQEQRTFVISLLT